MGHSFIAYIDESGDEGINSRRRGGGTRGGSSNWLTVSACVTRAANDAGCVGWRDEILRLSEKRTSTLHFVNLSHTQRLAAARVLADKPIRGISVLSNKASLDSSTFGDTSQYYFYVTRYLIERISWMAKTYSRGAPGDGRVKLIFSCRGSMSYDDFRAYLNHLKQNMQTSIYWNAIDIDGIEARDHSTRAGLQLADVIASAMACGVDPDHLGNCEYRYAEILKPVTYRNKKNYLSYGCKLIPGIDRMQLNEDQQRFAALFR